MFDTPESPVQLEDQDDGEPPLGRIIHKLSPGDTVGQVIGRGNVHVGLVDLPSLSLDEVPHGQKLGFRVLVLVGSRNPGWARAEGDIGICHAELEAALSQSPGKVSFISLKNMPAGTEDQTQLDKRFQEFVNNYNLFRGGYEPKTEGELKKIVKEALHHSIISLAQNGVREVSRGKFHSGQALDWSRMDFNGRSKAMIESLRSSLTERPGGERVKEQIELTLDGKRVLVVLHAIPAALSVPQAKEMVGQPFLRDHELASQLGEDRVGPFHIIACHRGAAESQATRLLGFPDATVVNAPFGVYVADKIQKVQFAFIVDCRDDTNTRNGVQRVLAWLEQTGEAALLAERAQSRTNIVKAIAEEVVPNQSSKADEQEIESGEPAPASGEPAIAA